MRAASPETMRQIDKYASDILSIKEETLMGNAGKGVYEKIKEMIDPSDTVLILCGKGNNAGDGYALGTELIRDKINVCCLEVFDMPPVSVCAQNFRNIYVSCGGKIAKSDKFKDEIKKSTVIADCIFGFGFRGNIDNESVAAKIIKACNESGCKRISVDVPSGINPESGEISDVNFSADRTYTLVLPKPGLYSYPAREYCGEISVLDIGIPKKVLDNFSYECEIEDDEFIKSIMPKRGKNTNKGTFGTLLSFTGSEYMTGAAVLSSMGALRSGVGLLKICGKKEVLSKLQNILYEPVFQKLDDDADKAVCEMDGYFKSASAVLCGCGIGKDEYAKRLTEHIIKNFEKTIILDADGINNICENIMILKEAKLPCIITPHPAEFARLLNTGVQNVNKNRINCARAFSREYNCIVVLKGAGTVIACPDGKYFINTTGNSSLSKGGSGDVLAGVIASLCAQGMSPPSACALAVYLHGYAGEKLSAEASQSSVLPQDLPRCIGKSLP